jgi:hypothetical protein
VFVGDTARHVLTRAAGVDKLAHRRVAPSRQPDRAMIRPSDRLSGAPSDRKVAMLKFVLLFFVVVFVVGVVHTIARRQD